MKSLAVFMVLLISTVTGCGTKSPPDYTVVGKSAATFTGAGSVKYLLAGREHETQASSKCLAEAKIGKLLPEECR